MPDQLSFEPLTRAHIDALASVLRHPEVYAHIEAAVPTLADFRLGLQRALDGPPASRPGERWLHFLVRDATGAAVGRLEATVHHGLAEVAFLLGRPYWGRGWARAGLLWLHGEVARRTGVGDFWATTTAGNLRSQHLLRRCGYVPSQPPAGRLYSHEPGDLVFHHRPGG